VPAGPWLTSIRRSPIPLVQTHGKGARLNYFLPPSVIDPGPFSGPLVTALPDNLLVKTDRMLMAFGLEGRVPFLDHRVVEFGLSLPDRLKVRRHQGKWLLKQWAAPLLPPGHLARPKRGFHVPVGDWLTGDLARRLGERLIANRGIRAWFEPAAIPTLVAARQAGRGGARERFGLMQFAIWHRLFIEEPGLKPGPEEDPLEWV